ncbi:hypothetical protein NBRC116596_03280 [Litorivita sp. NS0012-18]
MAPMQVSRANGAVKISGFLPFLSNAAGKTGGKGFKTKGGGVNLWANLKRHGLWAEGFAFREWGQKCATPVWLPRLSRWGHWG